MFLNVVFRPISILWVGQNVPALSLNTDITITVTTMTKILPLFFESMGRTNNEKILCKNKSQSIPDHQLTLNIDKNKNR